MTKEEQQISVQVKTWDSVVLALTIDLREKLQHSLMKVLEESLDQLPGKLSLKYKDVLIDTSSCSAADLGLTGKDVGLFCCVRKRGRPSIGGAEGTKIAGGAASKVKKSNGVGKKRAKQSAEAVVDK